MDLLNIPDHAASVLVGGVKVGERLIGGKRVFIYVPEGQSQIVWNLKPETVKPAAQCVTSLRGYRISKTIAVTLARKLNARMGSNI